MKKIFTLSIFLIAAQQLQGQTTEVIPQGYSGTAGGSTFTGPLTAAARSYQLVIDSSQLLNLIGKQINGLTFRTAASNSTTWPASSTTYTDYDVYMGPAVPLASTNSTFTNNQTGTQTQARSGSLTMTAGAFPTGGTNSWGQVITFSNPYTYNGGHLNILIRHSGAGANRTVDAAGTSTTGYGNLYRAAWGSGYTSTGGSQGNFAITQLTYTTPLSITLSDFRAQRDGDDALLRWHAADEESIVHFTIQKSYNGREFSDIGVVYASADNDGKEYQFRDEKINGNMSPAIFYRLVLLKANGELTYSHTVQISVQHTVSLVLAPNPASDMLNARFDLKQAATIRYGISDVSGRMVRTGTMDAQKGINELKMDVSPLPAGLYVFSLLSVNSNMTYQFIKR